MILDPKLAKMAHDVTVLRAVDGMTSEEAFDKIVESTVKAEEHIQRLIDFLVDMQGEFPMPEEGRKALIEDMEYTNKKHGWNLHLKKQEG